MDNPFKGRWRITEMEQWDKDDLDLIEPAYIEFEVGELSEFRFCAVQGYLDCRYEERDGSAFVEFSWDGWDEEDEVQGRGWAKIANKNTLTGHLFFHQGDDSAFEAKKELVGVS